MITNKREFIRLSEVEKLFPLTEEQVLDAVETDSFCFNAMVNVKGAGIVTKSFGLLATCDMTGIVSLTNAESRLLLTNKCWLTRLKIRKLVSATNKKSGKSAFPDALNGVFSSVKGSPINYDLGVGFVSTVSAVFPTEESLNNSMENSQGLKEIKRQPVEERSLLDILANSAKAVIDSQKALSISKHLVKPEEIRLDVKLLTDYFGLESRLDNGCDNRTVTERQPDIETNPIKAIQRRILDDFPEAKVMQVWNLIRSDIRNEEYKYDIDFVVTEITDERLYYKSGNSDGISTARFANLLSEVRKKAHG